MNKYSFRTFIFVVLCIFCCASKSIFAQNQQVNIGINYYNNKEWDKAISIFSELYEKSPSTFYYSYLVNSMYQTQQYNEILKLAKKHIKIFPNDYYAKVDNGYVLLQTGKEDKAYKEFDKLIANVENNKNQIRGLAGAFANKQLYDYSIKTYEQGRKILKEPIEFALDLGIMYQVVNRWEDMIDEYIILAKESTHSLSTVKNRLQYWLTDDLTGEKNKMLRSTLLKRAQKNPDEIIYNDLLLWFSIQQKDFDLALMQAIAIDKRYNEDGERVMEFAELCLNNKSFDNAIEAFKYLIKKDESQSLTIKSKTLSAYAGLLKYEDSFDNDIKKINKVRTELNDIIDTYGQNSYTFEAMMHIANIDAFYFNKFDEAIEMLHTAIEIPQVDMISVAEAKLQLADIYLFIGEQWEATLLYLQVEKQFKNEPIGHEAKFKNAKLSYYIGEFEWAKAQLNVLRGATSKLIANDAMELYMSIVDNVAEDSLYLPLLRFAQADLKHYQGNDTESLNILNKLINTFPGHPIVDDALFLSANIYLKMNNYDTAAKLYQTIVDQYYFDLLADNALFTLAKLYENKFNDYTKAVELYTQLVTQFSDSIYAVEARKKIRMLSEKIQQNNNT